MNLYELPTPNPTPKPTRHWQIVQNHTSEVVRINHLVKYVWIVHEIALGIPTKWHLDHWLWNKLLSSMLLNSTFWNIYIYGNILIGVHWDM